MYCSPIKKNPELLKATPNLVDYAGTIAEFSWDAIRDELQGLPDHKGLNIAHEAIDRHANGGLHDHLALRWLGTDDSVREFTYGDLKVLSNRFANILNRLGIRKGDRVSTLTERTPELYFAALGILKNTSVFCPLFSAFGPEPIYQRLSRADAKVLITTERSYMQKIRSRRGMLSNLKYVLLVDANNHLDSGLLSLPRLMAESSDVFTIPPTDPEDIAVLHFTSGTTGMPKGAIHVHKACR